MTNHDSYLIEFLILLTNFGWFLSCLFLSRRVAKLEDVIQGAAKAAEGGKG